VVSGFAVGTGQYFSSVLHVLFEVASDANQLLLVLRQWHDAGADVRLQCFVERLAFSQGTGEFVNDRGLLGNLFGQLANLLVLAVLFLDVLRNLTLQRLVDEFQLTELLVRV